MRKLSPIIYAIKCLKNGKLYIGQTIWGPITRFNAHKRSLKAGTHHNAHLQRSWNIHGEEGFVFHVIEKCQQDQLDDREKYWINVFGSCDRTRGFNVEAGGVGLRRTTIDKTRRILSKINKGKPMSEEQKRKISESLSGMKIHSEYQKNKWSKERSGSGNSFYGKKHSIETRMLLSKIRTGKPNKSKGKKRKPFSEESRKRMSEAHKGKPRSKLFLARLRIALNTPEYRKKRSDIAKRIWAKRKAVA